MDPRIAWHQREHLGPTQEHFDRLWAVAVASQQTCNDVILLSDASHHSVHTSRSGSKIASRCGSPALVSDGDVVLNRFIQDVRNKSSHHQNHHHHRPPHAHRIGHKHLSANNLCSPRWHSDRSCDDVNEDDASSSRSSSTGSCADTSILNPSLLARSFVNKSRPENRASTYDLHRNRKALTGDYQGMPWVPTNKLYSNDTTGLHEDIVDFCVYMSPSAEESDMRTRVFRRLQTVIHKILPNVILDYFGSFRTELYLPTSDIDAVVIGSFPHHLPLLPISAALRDNRIAAEGSIKVLDKASVPIIKYMDRETEIRVDISFNMTNGVRSAELIKHYLDEFPPLRQLVYVLKYFLLERDLNETHSGSNTRSHKYNLGELLLEFFELYGKKFNYFQTGIRIKERGCYMAKDALLKQMGDPHGPSILCIEDPLLPGNDIGRSSYGVMSVKEAFAYAYKTLCEAVFQEVPYIFTDGSILARVIQVTDAVVHYRAMLKEQWNSLKDGEENQNDSATISYASVVMGSNRKSESETGPEKADAPRSASADSASCSELSSDNESDTSSHSSSSGSDLSSRRSYSSVASSGLPTTTAATAATSAGRASKHSPSTAAARSQTKTTKTEARARKGEADGRKGETEGRKGEAEGRKGETEGDGHAAPLRPSKSYNNGNVRNTRRPAKGQRQNFAPKSPKKRR